jgi:hypothetical protein
LDSGDRVRLSASTKVMLRPGMLMKFSASTCSSSSSSSSVCREVEQQVA